MASRGFAVSGESGSVAVALRLEMIERIGQWCWQCEDLAEERDKARSLFFGDDDPRPVKYWPGAGAEEALGMERRFYGWFMFDYILTSGERPAEVAARSLYAGVAQVEILKAITGTRYLLGMAVGFSRRGVYLRLDDEEFEVQSRTWMEHLSQYQMVVARLVPVRQGYWLPGPGWMLWPFTTGPHLRENLKMLQLDPIKMERLLQGRSGEVGEPEPPEPPRDRDIASAVARMAAWAREQGHPRLAMDVQEWQWLVLQYLPDRGNDRFVDELLKKLDREEPIETFQAMLDLATNIWNNTPQPNRGGKSANEMMELRYGRMD